MKPSQALPTPEKRFRRRSRTLPRCSRTLPRCSRGFRIEQHRVVSVPGGLDPVSDRQNCPGIGFAWVSARFGQVSGTFGRVSWNVGRVSAAEEPLSEECFTASRREASAWPSWSADGTPTPSESDRRAFESLLAPSSPTRCTRASKPADAPGARPDRWLLQARRAVRSNSERLRRDRSDACAPRA